MTGGPATLAEIEDLFADTIMTVGEMNGTLKTVLATQATMARAHTDIGVAVTLMAKTFEKLEERQGNLEKTNNDLYKEKGVSPKIFMMVTGVLGLVIILGAVWVTDTFIKASYNSLEAGRRKSLQEIQSSLDDTKKEIVDELKHGN